VLQKDAEGLIYGNYKTCVIMSCIYAADENLKNELKAKVKKDIFTINI
jgi:hypothetical protein